MASSQLAQWDDVRTLTRKKRDAYNSDIPSREEGAKFDWQVPVQDLLLHAMDCQTECPQLNLALDKLFQMVSEYQKQAA